VRHLSGLSCHAEEDQLISARMFGQHKVFDVERPPEAEHRARLIGHECERARVEGRRVESGRHNRPGGSARDHDMDWFRDLRGSQAGSDGSEEVSTVQ